MHLCNHAKASLKTGFGETSADGEVTLEAVYCLGNCALSPAMMVDGNLYGRVDPQRFDADHDEDAERGRRHDPRLRSARFGRPLDGRR